MNNKERVELANELKDLKWEKNRLLKIMSDENTSDERMTKATILYNEVTYDIKNIEKKLG